MPEMNEQEKKEKLEEEKTVKNENDSQEEKINAFLKQMQEENNLTQEELATVRLMLENTLRKRMKSKKRRFLNGLKRFLYKTFILYIISLIVFGFLFTFLALDNKLEIFLVSIVIGVVLSIFEMLPSLIKGSKPKAYILLFILIIANFCLLNNLYMVFIDWFMWIIYFVAVELLYGVIVFYNFRKKFRA